MTDRLLFVLTLLSALGSGLVGGVLFAFSAFVMKAFVNLPSEQGIAAMQSVNVTVINPWFLGAFVGTAVTSVLSGIFSVVRWSESGSGYLLIGSVLYLVGTFLLTVVIHLPMNAALADLEPSAADSASWWTGFTSRWTAWNHVRTIAALAAATSFMIGLRKLFA